MDMADLNGLGPRSRIIVGVVIAVIVGVGLWDLSLSGERVDSKLVSLRPGSHSTLRIKDIGQEHQVEIDTRGLVGRQVDKGPSLSIRLEDLMGEPVYESRNCTEPRRCCFSFTPKVAGDYKIEIQLSGQEFKEPARSTFVSVRTGDRRFLRRLLSSVGFE